MKVTERHFWESRVNTSTGKYAKSLMSHPKKRHLLKKSILLKDTRATTESQTHCLLIRNTRAKFQKSCKAENTAEQISFTLKKKAWVVPQLQQCKLDGMFAYTQFLLSNYCLCLASFYASGFMKFHPGLVSGALKGFGYFFKMSTDLHETYRVWR